MSTTTTTRESATGKPALTRPQPTAPKKDRAAAGPAPAEAEREAKPESKPEPEPTTLVEALTAGQAVLIKVRANGTRRSLPYLAVGTEQRTQAEAVARMREDGQTVDAIAEALKVSTATARRFVTNLDLAHAVEAGQHDKGWKPGTREVVVHVVTARPTRT